MVVVVVAAMGHGIAAAVALISPESAATWALEEPTIQTYHLIPYYIVFSYMTLH